MEKIAYRFYCDHCKKICYQLSPPYRMSPEREHPWFIVWLAKLLGQIEYKWLCDACMLKLTELG